MRFFVYYKFRQKSEVLVIIKKGKKKEKKEKICTFFNVFVQLF